MSNSKENILQRLREASNIGNFSKFDIDDSRNLSFVPADGQLSVFFKKEIEKVSGNCILCEDEEEIIEEIKTILQEKKLTKILCKDDKIKQLLNTGNILYKEKITDYNDIEVSITPCDFLSARTGSVIISSTLLKEREIQIFAPVHFIIAYETQLLSDLDLVMKEIEKKYSNNYPSQISVITGQSRTADIEKTLILGAHGPKEIFVFLIQNK